MPLRLSLAARMTVGALRGDARPRSRVRRRAARRAARPAAPTRTRAAPRRWPSRACTPWRASCAAGPAAPGGWPRRVRRGRPRAGRSGVVGGDDDVGVADQADATAETEAVHGGDDRHGALVDGGKGGEAALVGADQGVEALGGLHLLDVDAGVEPASLGPEHHDTHRPVGSEVGEGAGEVEPTLDGQRVHRGVVDDDLRDPALVHRRGDSHGPAA